MAEVRFPYHPAVLPATMQSCSADDIFGFLYPDHWRWLKQTGAGFRVTSYHWPEFISLYWHNQIGTIVCEMELFIASEFADQFSQFLAAT